MKPPECQELVYRGPDRMVPCGKLLYQSEEEAVRVLQAMRDTGSIPAETGRVYPAHGGWHITSLNVMLNGKPGKAHGTLADDPTLNEWARRFREEES